MIKSFCAVTTSGSLYSVSMDDNLQPTATKLELSAGFLSTAPPGDQLRMKNGRSPDKIGVSSKGLFAMDQNGEIGDRTPPVEWLFLEEGEAIDCVGCIDLSKDNKRKIQQTHLILALIGPFHPAFLGPEQADQLLQV